MTFRSVSNNYTHAHVQSYGNQHGFSEENFERTSKDAFHPLCKRQVLKFHGGVVFLVPCAFSHLFSFLDKKYRTKM